MHHPVLSLGAPGSTTCARDVLGAVLARRSVDLGLTGTTITTSGLGRSTASPMWSAAAVVRPRLSAGAAHGRGGLRAAVPARRRGGLPAHRSQHPRRWKGARPLGAPGPRKAPDGAPGGHPLVCRRRNCRSGARAAAPCRDRRHVLRPVDRRCGLARRGRDRAADARLPRDDRRLRRARSGADFLGIALAVAVWLGYLVRRQVLRWLAGKRPGGGRTDQVATREPTVSVTASSHGRRGRGSSLSGR